MNANLRLPPTEVWTDIFSFLPRRTLVQRVQPVNSWFKAICDKNVKSVHVIGDIGDLMWKLGQKKVWARRQLEALEGHDGPLANHFRMTNVQIYYNGRNEAKLAVLRNSLDLFRHCQLIIFPETKALRSYDELAEQSLAYLTTLQPAKPISIEMRLEMRFEVFRPFIDTHLSDLLCHPTTLNCARLKLSGRFDAWISRQAFFDWLHHKVDVEEHGEEVRCLILNQNFQFTEWLGQQCVQNFKQSKVPEDHHCFVLTFHRSLWYSALANFEYKNQATGEVLLLERVLNENGQATRYSRLVRCSAHQIADNNGKEQLYAKLFKSTFEFRLEHQGDAEPAKVEIF